MSEMRNVQKESQEAGWRKLQAKGRGRSVKRIHMSKRETR